MTISEVSIILSTISIFLLLILKVSTVLELLENKVWWIWWWKNKEIFEKIDQEEKEFKFWKTTNSDSFFIVETLVNKKEIKFPFSKNIINKTFKIEKQYKNKSLFNINKILNTSEKIYYFFINISKNKNEPNFKLKFRTTSKFEVFKILKKFDLIYTESSIKKLI